MAVTTIPTAGIADDAVTSPKILDSHRLVSPLIINGDMAIAQRGTSITGITTNTYSLDRYTTEGDDCTLTISQDTSVPTGQGFSTSLKMDVTTANSSRDAGDVQVISQRLEGQNMQMLKYGTSSAEATTLSFWCRMSQTGTYIVRLYADDGDRHICKTFTIDAADTWEKKIINIPGDTAGTINNDNGRAMRVTWILDAGTDYTSGTLATSWAASVNANRAVGITTGWLDSTSSDFYLTGVQWEVGTYDSTTIPEFPFESTESNLRRCRRYYEMIVNKDVNAIIATGGCYQADVVSINYQWYPKRSTPSIDQGSGSNYFGFNRGGGAITFNSIKIYSGRANTGLLYSDDGVSASTYENGWIYAANANAYVALDSEL